jgi:hypothetical protein
MFENAVTNAVRDMDARLADLDPEAIARLEENSTLETSEWLALGDMASRAMLDGVIDAETAQSLHVIHTRFNGEATLAERIVFMQCATELLSARIGR